MRDAHTLLLTVVAIAAAAAVAVLGVLAASTETGPPPPDDGSTLVDARIVTIEPASDVDVTGLAPGAEPIVVTARLDSGETVTFDMVDETGDTFAEGQPVRVAATESPEGGVTYYVSDIRRDGPLLALAGAFLAAVLLFGRWQGLRALIGLSITFAVVILIVVPAVLGGSDPLLTALSAAVAIMVATLYLTHGLRPKTTAAVVGTLAALSITVGLSWVFVEATSLTGLADEEARLASVQVGGLSLQGLLLAGIVIGALGVLDDVTMAQSSTVFQLRSVDPHAGTAQLFSRAMTVGRDHVASTINTLFLAYAGASLPLLILFSESPDPFGVIVSSEVVAIEIVRTLVGSIGLVASVPLTTWLAAWLARGAPPRAVAGAGSTPPTDERHAEPGWEPRDDRDVREVLADVKPFSADDAAESEWERRLRSSYGLDRRRGSRGQRE